MPIQYPAGHPRRAPPYPHKPRGCSTSRTWARRWLEGPTTRRSRELLESLCPADILNLARGRQRYTQLLNDEGGIVDDLMVTRPPGADGRAAGSSSTPRAKTVDFALIAAAPARRRPADAASRTRAARAARPARRRATLAAGARAWARGDGASWRATGAPRGFEIFVSRSGYTGEDGYEISLPADAGRSLRPQASQASRRSRRSASAPAIPLRLEAGLCLYGHELDETVDPVEAGLVLVDPQAAARRGRLPRRGAHPGRAGEGPTRQRVGLEPDGRAPAREGAEIVSRRRRRRSASSPPAGSARASAARSPWAMSREATRRSGTPLSSHGARQAAARACRHAALPSPRLLSRLT